VLQRSLETLGFSQDDVVNIFKIVASVLKLGNIGFIPTNNIDGTEGCTVSNDYGKFNDNFSFISLFQFKLMNVFNELAVFVFYCWLRVNSHPLWLLMHTYLCHFT